jgi:hypothetical protein
MEGENVMSSWAYLLAASLLTTPPDVPEPPIPADDWPCVQEALQNLAVEWEILDPKEVRYVLARRDDFENDLNLLRRRYQDLQDAPKLSDCQRFPDRGTVTELLAFNRAYRRFLDARQTMEHDRCACVRMALKETDSLYQVWDAVRDARCDYYYVTVRRQALKRLQTMLGPDGYAAGELPPHVPLWRFSEN